MRTWEEGDKDQGREGGDEDQGRKGWEQRKRGQERAEGEQGRGVTIFNIESKRTSNLRGMSFHFPQKEIGLTPSLYKILSPDLRSYKQSWASTINFVCVHSRMSVHLIFPKTILRQAKCRYLCHFTTDFSSIFLWPLVS
jgi:hypothetical protein